MSMSMSRGVEPFQSFPYTLPSGKLLNVDPFFNRDAWLAARRDHIGASEVAAIMDLSPYSSPLEVYARKIGKANENIENDAMTWGLMQEDPIARWVQEKLGYQVLPSPGAVESIQCPHMSCTPDRILMDETGLLYIAEFKHSAKDWSDGIPESFKIQVQVNMDITGIHRALLVGALAGRAPVHHFIEYDPQLCKLIRTMVAQFWELHVVPQSPPEPDGSASAARALNALYPNDDGTTIQFTRSVVPIHNRREEVVDLIAKLEEEKDELTNKIKAALHESSKGIYIAPPDTNDPSFAYSYKVVERKEYVVKASSTRQLRKVKV